MAATEGNSFGGLERKGLARKPLLVQELEDVLLRLFAGMLVGRDVYAHVRRPASVAAPDGPPSECTLEDPLIHLLNQPGLLREWNKF